MPRSLGSPILIPYVRSTTSVTPPVFRGLRGKAPRRRGSVIPAAGGDEVRGSLSPLKKFYSLDFLFFPATT